MKTSIFLSALLLSALTMGQVNAQTNDHGRTFGDGTLPDFLEIYDTDGDGVLSEEERQAMREARRDDRHQHFIDEWDTDGDGVLSEEEKEAAHIAIRERIIARRALRFDEADINGDGFLSPEEFKAIPAVARLLHEYPEKVRMIFNRLDADDDGLISKEEFMAHLHHRSPPPDGDDGDGTGGDTPTD